MTLGSGRGFIHSETTVVQQKTHRSSSRGESWTRSSCKLESRRGEAAKNSARFPTRRVLRSHSSAETITAVSWPLRVMLCGRAGSGTVEDFAEFSFGFGYSPLALGHRETSRSK